MLTKIILKIIMSGGIGMLVFAASGTLLCPLQVPIDTGLCVQMTSNIWLLLRHAGIIPYIMGSLGGVTVYLMASRGKNN